MNKFIEMLKQQKAEKMGKVVNKIEPTEQDVINATKKQVEDLCKEEVKTPKPKTKRVRKKKSDDL